MNSKAIKTTILCCWGAYIVCCIIKVFGGDWFSLAEGSGNFIAFCLYVDTHIWLKYLLNICMSLVLNSLCLLSIMQEKWFTKVQMLLFIPLIISQSLISWYSSMISVILSFIIYLIPIFFSKDKYIALRCIIGIVLILVFQVLSLWLKNVGTLFLNNESTVTAIILNIDSVILCVLYYLYSNYFKIKLELKGGN